MSNEDILNKIIQTISGSNNPKIERVRLNQISDFIKTTINGDEAKECLTVNAILKKDTDGILVYVLTNLRLINIEIDAHAVRSSSFPLDTMIGIDRKLMDGNRIAVEVSFQNGSLGLAYSSTDQTTTDFFQKVDQSRVLRSNG
jgi:hypothetical protein